MVTDWMLSVCTDTALAHSTNPEVFTLAVNFLDRFLSVCRWDIVRDTYRNLLCHKIKKPLTL